MGEVTVQSVDPCVGGDEVYLRLLDASGAPGTFLPFLDVDADGSWGGTIVLQPGVAPGSYELRADCVNGSGGSSNYATTPFTVTVPDTTPPTITATATPAPNANGWNNTDVTVSYSCTDSGSGVDQVASSLGNDVLTASGTATGTCVDLAGNSASASYTAQIDKVGPTVSYAGNAGTYWLLETVAITCTAADALSGVASSTCANANGPAWTFGAGAHTLSANATDRAGNTGSGSTTFTVIVTPAGALQPDEAVRAELGEVPGAEARTESRGRRARDRGLQRSCSTSARRRLPRSRRSSSTRTRRPSRHSSRLAGSPPTRRRR